MSSSTKEIKISRNPYLLFSPFLLLYILIVLFLHSDTLWGDESRYLMYAQNLIHGFYSGSDSDLSNGPGYPIILTPFIALHLPLLVIKLLNPVFYYFSVVFLFKVLRRIVSFKMTLLFSLFWACYYNAYENMPLLLTETFTIFLVSALMFCLTKAFNEKASKKTNKYIFLSGFLFGYIALTKVIFGYVILFMLIGCVLLWLLNRGFVNYRKALAVVLIAFITTTPYLIYTYNLTGRVFYWSTISGNNLYWMSSPEKNEYGSWLADPKFGSDSISSFKENTSTYSGGGLNFKNRPLHIQGFRDSVRSNHRQDYEEINKYKGLVEQDDAFKRIAIKNIKSHPLKFMENCFSNIGRILFNYPYSYKVQGPETLLRLPFSGIVALLMIFCFIPTLLNWRKIDFSIRFMILFAFIYLGGSVLGSAETRMFTLILPILLFWIAAILKRTIKIRLKFSNNIEQAENHSI
ncbi:MAG TPA: glycosyltransferase family 39 protein [Chitinophagaceae bacterium]|nr:glycosyltransferase family 39 protein [Chitinophagaceae bacterium]